MSKIIDLDALVPEDKKVSLGGSTYTVPGDMPMPIFMKLQRAAQLEEDGAEDVTGVLKDALFELFTVKMPESDTAAREKLDQTLSLLGIKTFLSLFSAIYGDLDDVEEEEDPTSPPAAESEGAAGTTSTNPTTETAALTPAS